MNTTTVTKDTTQDLNNYKLKLLFLNLQSIRNKICFLNGYLNDKNFDFLCFQEHWLTKDECNTLDLDNYKVIGYYNRNTTKSGGVVSLVHESRSEKVKILHVINNLSVESHCEIFAFQITNIIVMNIYRTPKGNLKIFMESIDKALSLIDQANTVIIGGDFNVKFNQALDDDTITLCDFFNSFKLNKTVTFLTRGKNCLDNVFSNYHMDKIATEKALIPFSDHDGISFSITTNISDKIQSPIHFKEVQPITSMGKSNMFNHLLNISWDFIEDDNLNVDQKFDIFIKTVIDASNIAFPKKLVKVRSKKKPEIYWFNEKIKKMRDTLDLLHSYYLLNPTNTNKLIRNNFRKKYRDAIRQARTEANSNFIKNSKNTSKATWDIINKNKSHKSETQCPLSSNEMNDYFVSIAKNLISKIPTVQADPIALLKSSITLQSNVSPLSFTEVSPAQVRDVIKALKNKATRDAYGLNVHIIKYITNAIISPLTKLINMCIKANIFPTALKLASVVPIYKKGDKNDKNNYRPISLLPIFSKILENILKVQILNHLEKYDILSPQQFGFRTNKSTTSAILEFIDFVTQCFENKEFCAAIFFDLTKAFDCVDYAILLAKLKFYGFDENSCRLILSYLTNRKQFVTINGKSSESKIIEHGVPQGSILGPILFLIYINDFSYANKLVKQKVLYADDTTILNSNATLDNLLTHNNEAKTSCIKWFHTNKLSTNESKTEEMILTLKLFPDGLRNTESVKFLGVHINNKLNWGTHINAVAGSICKSTYCLRNLQKSVSSNVLKIVYFSFIHSYLSYAILVWGHAPQAERLFSLQRRAVRIIGGIGYREDCREQFRKLKILTLPCLYILQCLIHIHTNIEDYSSHAEIHNYDTRSKANIYCDLTRLSRSRHCKNYYAIRFFNTLPLEFRSLPSNIFQNSLKRYLIAKAFYSLNEYFYNNFDDLLNSV